VDAEAAARAALNGEATVVPKSHDDSVESIRVLRIAFCSARDTNPSGPADQDLIVTLRPPCEKACPHERRSEWNTALVFDPRPREPQEATRLALKTLSRRYQT